jgi:hypothetical protein
MEIGANGNGEPAGGGLVSFHGGKPPMAMKPTTPIKSARLCFAFKTTFSLPVNFRLVTHKSLTIKRRKEPGGKQM